MSVAVDTVYDCNVILRTQKGWKLLGGVDVIIDENDKPVLLTPLEVLEGKTLRIDWFVPGKSLFLKVDGEPDMSVVYE